MAPRVGPVRSIRGPDFSRAGASSSGGSAISSSRSRSSPKAREPRSGWLERIVRKWLKARAAAAEDDDAEQERLRAVAMQFVGTIRGGDPDRAAEAGKWLCELLARKHGREGTDRHWREPNSLDRDDRRREPRVVSLATSRLPLGTSATALTEVFHLLRNQPRRTAMAWNFVRSAAVTVLAINDADLAARDRLMRKYADPPADFPRRRWCTWRAGIPEHGVHHPSRRFRDLPDRWQTALSHRARPLSRSPRSLPKPPADGSGSGRPGTAARAGFVYGVARRAP